MLIEGRAPGLIGISNQWIDEVGNSADLALKLGRLGEDVSEFAIHTMGWIRCTTIGAFEEYSFDTRSVHLASLEALLHRLTAPPTGPIESPRLRCIEVTTRLGTTKISDDRPSRLISLVRKCMEIADPRTPQDAIHRRRMEMSALAGISDDLASGLIGAWRDAGGVLRAPVWNLLTDKALQRSVKMMVPHGDTFRLVRYKGSPNAPWDQATWRSFEGGTLDQVVPDRGMIESVKASTRSALAARDPLIELCEGVIIASDGLKELQWYRITLPVEIPGNRGRASSRGVIALLSPVPQSKRAA